MPPAASSKRPAPPFSAPVKAPFSWPNSSLSTSASGSAAQLTLTSARFARARPRVDGARDELLARPGLARDQHGRVGRRDARDPLQHLAQPGGGPDDPARRRRHGDLLPQGEVLVLELGSELLDLLEGERVRDRRGDRPGHVLEDRNLVGWERQTAVVRANTSAATNASPMVSGTTTAHSAPARFIAVPSSRGSFLTSLNTSVRRSRSTASRTVGCARTCLPCHRSLPRSVGRTPPGSRPSAADRCASRSRDSGPRAFVGDHADHVDRHEPLERARHRLQHARQVALRVRRLRHGQERLVLRLPRPTSVHATGA